MSGLAEALQSYAGRFVGELVSEFPVLSHVVDQSSCGEFLPHLFMADVVRFLESKHTETDGRFENEVLIKGIMNLIGQEFEAADPLTDELIAVSFVENMPYAGEPAADMVKLLPANLKAELRKQRGPEYGL